MAASTKLATSVRAVCFLAEAFPDPQSSRAISDAVGVNASKLRRLLSMLARSGIVTSTQGKTGGFVLGKAPEEIHLQEIYCAVEDRKAFHLEARSRDDIDHRSAAFNTYFLDLFARIQIDIEDQMRTISVAAVMQGLGMVSAYGGKGMARN